MLEALKFALKVSATMATILVAMLGVFFVMYELLGNLGFGLSVAGLFAFSLFAAKSDLFEMDNFYNF